ASVSCTAVENWSRTAAIWLSSAANRSSAARNVAASPNSGSMRGLASVRNGIVTGGAGAGGTTPSATTATTNKKTIDKLDYERRRPQRQKTRGAERSRRQPHRVSLGGELTDDSYLCLPAPAHAATRRQTGGAGGGAGRRLRQRHRQRVVRKDDAA